MDVPMRDRLAGEHHHAERPDERDAHGEDRQHDAAHGPEGEPEHDEDEHERDRREAHQVVAS